MTDENTARRDLEASSDAFIEQFTTLIRRYDYDPLNLLARFVATLCDVDVADMLTSVDKVRFSQARAFLWFAYRYVTRASFGEIARLTSFDGHSFSTSSVAASIVNMSALTDSDPVWRKRWIITKRFFNAKRAADDAFVAKYDERAIKITLSAPKGTKVELKEI